MATATATDGDNNDGNGDSGDDHGDNSGGGGGPSSWPQPSSWPSPSSTWATVAAVAIVHVNVGTCNHIVVIRRILHIIVKLIVISIVF